MTTQKRNTRTIRDIKRAMMTLLKSKHLEQVTMSEIAREAQISRSTLYNHYSTVMDIYEAIVQDFWNETAPMMSAIGIDATAEDTLLLPSEVETVEIDGSTGIEQPTELDVSDGSVRHDRGGVSDGSVRRDRSGESDGSVRRDRSGESDGFVGRNGTDQLNDLKDAGVRISRQPFCLLLRSSENYQSVINEQAFLDSLLAHPEYLKKHDLYRALIETGYSEDQAKALCAFQLTGCFVISQLSLDDGACWESIRTVVDRFIGGGIKACLDH